MQGEQEQGGAGGDSGECGVTGSRRPEHIRRVTDRRLCGRCRKKDPDKSDILAFLTRNLVRIPRTLLITAAIMFPCFPITLSVRLERTHMTCFSDTRTAVGSRLSVVLR